MHKTNAMFQSNQGHHETKYHFGCWAIWKELSGWECIEKGSDVGKLIPTCQADRASYLVHSGSYQ